MGIYVFNLLVGYSPNGVDNAQGYRAQMLKNYPLTYIFTDLPERIYINQYQNVGISIKQMLSIHHFFTDNRSLELSGQVSAKLEELKEILRYTHTIHSNCEIRLYRDNMKIASILLDEARPDYYYGIHYFKNENLVRTEMYTNGMAYANFYVTASDNNKPYAKLTRRTFYNKDGSVAYCQVFEDENERYFFPDGSLLTKQQLIADFIQKLCLTEQDILLIDRPACFDFLQPLFQFGQKARYIAILHSGHFYEKGEDPYCTYLNWEYYYLFKYVDKIDTMVVSTQEQKKELKEKLTEYNCKIPNIEVIPAGCLHHLRYPKTKRNPYSLISVSRIDKRKKVEWIVKSVIKAHQHNPRIHLDIYGNNSYGYLQYLQAIISAHQAEDYIRFMGYADVTDVYQNYEVYISASLWETLGLSIMEAIGSGTAAIGLNARYGNRLFIHPDKNGFLIDFDLNQDIEDDNRLIHEFADKIIDIFSDEERLEHFHQSSYEIAQDFTFEIIAEKWKRLLAFNERQNPEYDSD